MRVKQIDRRVKTMTTELKVNELDQVTGGNFIPNLHTDEEYRNCGIMVVNNIFYDDLFVWKGQQLGCFEAHHIVEFIKANGCQPDTLEEAERFWYSNQGPRRRRK
jgi:hypothetical protein